MATCKKEIINIISSFLLTLLFITPGYCDLSFKSLEDKKVSYLDFFLLKFENKLNKRALVMRRQLFASRVQYSNVGTAVDFDEKSKKISINIYAIMDKFRYSKKNYNPKLSDCNQVRNLIFYNKHGYKFFTQKRDSALSESVMEDIFKDFFFDNMTLNEKEVNFLLSKMSVNVTIFHPVKKKELSCSGKVNDYELN